MTLFHFFSQSNISHIFNGYTINHKQSTFTEKKQDKIGTVKDELIDFFIQAKKEQKQILFISRFNTTTNQQHEKWLNTFFI